MTYNITEIFGDYLNCIVICLNGCQVPWWTPQEAG